jgi:hypothetical protein
LKSPPQRAACAEPVTKRTNETTARPSLSISNVLRRIAQNRSADHARESRARQK